MLSDNSGSFEISRYRLSLRASEPATLPAFLGSTLRGAFGHALKASVCVMPHRDCQRCLVATRCIYPYLFETPVPPDVPQLRGQQQAPRPFILTPPVLESRQKQPGPKREITQSSVSAHRLSDGRTVRLLRSTAQTPAQAERHLKAGEGLVFELLLMGRAIEHLPYVVYAVSEMGRRGLGACRARFDLAQVMTLEENGAGLQVYCGQSQRFTFSGQSAGSLSDLINRRMDSLTESGACNLSTLKLRFLTPTRIRVNGDLQAELSFELLVRNLLRRVSLLAAVHGDGSPALDYRRLIELAARVETFRSDLRWHDWERYSNRQREKMKLGGFLGEVEYIGEAVNQLLPLIIAGEILHVGAGTSFGLGKYRIIAPEAITKKIGAS